MKPQPEFLPQWRSDSLIRTGELPVLCLPQTAFSVVMQKTWFSVTINLVLLWSLCSLNCRIIKWECFYTRENSAKLISDQQYGFGNIASHVSDRWQVLVLAVTFLWKECCCWTPGQMQHHLMAASRCYHLMGALECSLCRLGTCYFDDWRSKI